METWVAVASFPDYEVSDRARVRRGGRILAPWIDKKGYFYVTLYYGQRRKKNRGVHQLVAAAFLGVRPTSKHEVNHKDGDPSNNRVDNLEWCTKSENMLHASRVLGKMKGPRGRGNAKLTDSQVREIRQRVKAGAVAMRLAPEYGLHKQSIYNIVWRKTFANVK